MKDTPRTDELFNDCGDADCNMGQTLSAMVGLCRNLERELNESQREADMLRRENNRRIDDFYESYVRCEMERDKAVAGGKMVLARKRG